LAAIRRAFNFFGGSYSQDFAVVVKKAVEELKAMTGRLAADGVDLASLAPQGTKL